MFVVITTLVLIIVSALGLFRRYLLDYVSFRCGLDWLSPIAPLEYVICFRLCVAGVGLLAIIVSAFPILPGKASRVLYGAVGVLCFTTAFFGTWASSRQAYMEGLGAAISKPSLRSAIRELKTQEERSSGTETMISDLPQALRELGEPLSAAKVFSSGELRLLWGSRSTGGWGISIGKDKPQGVNRYSKHVFDDVYVTFAEPF